MTERKLICHVCKQPIGDAVAIKHRMCLGSMKKDANEYTDSILKVLGIEE
jgi:hypothetical protein